MNELIIRILNKEEAVPYDLLYLADPSAEAVSDYLNRGTCYVGELDGKVIGVFVLLPTRPFTIELVNLAIAEQYHNMGYGKKMVQYAIDRARDGNYKVLELGTGNAGIGQMALYQKCGFTITSVDFDFFRKHYAEPIYENGIECRHMIRLSIDL
ncbi:GNAT family N-acetyltransferase [Dysgonomonas sp. 521]|uniref:GNAT family N-acetyltransferase n=1 Tax=Dysgonomonas sp. 521 TaxID=2302932 RepID=UPI0013CF5991|nr:GNAT family N-acetyltransferase [Dysgonomonas sp. 521]NDV96961.1 GNAT family N-acetyltransferase [Dysgonomonas sp. 521]